MANSQQKIKQKFSIWWKFKYPLFIALLMGFIISIFSATDINIGATVINSAPPVAMTIGSTIGSIMPVGQTTASILDVPQNFSNSQFNIIFWVTFIAITITLWIVLAGIEVLFGKKGEVFGK